jgi:Fibronectin type III domain
MRFSILVPAAVSASLIAAPLAIGSTPAAASALPEYGVTWTVDSAANSLSEYAPNASGAATAIAVVTGVDTGLNDPTGVALGPGGAVYVSNAGNDSITEYSRDASNDAIPVATISGANTGLDKPQGISVADGQVWVADPPSNVVEAFSTGSSGNELPAQTIAGPKTQLDHPSAVSDSVDDGGIVVANTPPGGPATITGYFKGKPGNISPDVVATGTTKHPIKAPSALYSGADGTTWIVDSKTNTVSENFLFPGIGSGLFTLRRIAGAATGLNAPSGVAVDARDDVIVTNAGDQSVRVFGANAKGDVAPIRTITGVGAASGAPNGDAVFGTAPGAPTNVQVRLSKTAAHLTWKAPAQTGGGLMGYVVLVESVEKTDGGFTVSSGGSIPGEPTGIGETTKTHYTQKHLKRGRTYLFQVLAINAFGEGEARPVLKTLVAPPSRPRHVSATSGHHSIAVHWSKPANDGGQSITSYNVEYAKCSFAAKGCSFTSRSVAGSHTFATIHGLKPGTTYHVRVVANNKTKLGVPSRVVEATPLA